MHFLNRLLTLAITGMVLVPSLTLALVSMDDRHHAEESLDEAYNAVANQYRMQSGIEALQQRGEREKQEYAVTLQALEDQKFDLRKRVAREWSIIRFVEETYHVALPNKDAVRVLIDAEKQRTIALVKEHYVQSLTAGSSHVPAVMQTVLHGSAPTQDARTILTLQQRLVRDLVAAQKAWWRLETLQQQRDDVLDRYWEAQRAYDHAEALVQRSAAQIRQIQRIIQEVHREVLAMQGELSRIDAQLRRTAERALIDKGLLDAEAARLAVEGAVQRFQWPVTGKVSAGFHDKSYVSVFGVAHEGIDIPVPQSTPVRSSADGVVYLVRDGGATGYTYVLVAHRAGFATLYGHLSSVIVQQGQQISAGMVIGLSGGTPGTRGAGPMTTGPHLHFEVINAGVNVDPLAVLP